MPIKIQKGLPAKAILESENIFVMDEERAIAQDIRPLQILILNLMPIKEDTETQILRALSNTPLQVDCSFLMMKSHHSKNTSQSHLNKFYTFFEDIKSGYIINVCTRVEKKIYFKAKYLAVFLSGGVTVVAPLLLNLVLSSMFMPAFIPDNGTVGTISPTTMAYEVFFTHPLVYVLMFIVIDFIFAGVMATLALSYTYFTEHRFGVMIVPFVFYFFIYSLTNLIDKTDYSLFFMLNGGANNNYLPVYILYFLLFFALSYVIFMWKGKKQDVKA